MEYVSTRKILPFVKVKELNSCKKLVTKEFRKEKVIIENVYTYILWFVSEDICKQEQPFPSQADPQWGQVHLSKV